MTDTFKSDISPELWVDKYGDYLYKYARVRVGSVETAEDIVQDTFVAALKSYESFKGNSSELTWLLSILKRKIVDYYRAKSRKIEFTESYFEMPFQNKDGFIKKWIEERAPKDWKINDEPLRGEEFEKIVLLCLSFLPEKWKSVFVLKILEDMNTLEICKELGCTDSNVWVMLHRAKLKLRECIEKKWLD